MQADPRLIAMQLAPARQRIAGIEAQALLRNVGALLDSAADACPEREALNFFESGEAYTYMTSASPGHETEEARRSGPCPSPIDPIIAQGFRAISSTGYASSSFPRRD